MASHYTSHGAVCTPEWILNNHEKIQEDSPTHRLIEVNKDASQYDDWHIPGAVSIDWETDFVTEVGGDIVSPDHIETVLGSHGVTPDTTVILYGGMANWFASHAYWVLKYYGHTDVQLLDGSREYWDRNDYPKTTEESEYTSRDYEVTTENNEVRATKSEVKEAVGDGKYIIDVRNPQEYRGEKPPAEIPDTTTIEGHIPSADNVPWANAVNMDGTFKPVSELESVYDQYIQEDKETISYCRIGERSSITWFVLHELLGEGCKNYDGSWTDWADDPNTPVTVGTPRQGGDD